MMGLADRSNVSDPAGTIAAVREVLASNIRAFTDPDVKAWCGRRWRYLFLNEAVKDPVALYVATRWGDKRPARQRISERFLVDGAGDWRDEQPPADTPAIANTTLLFCPGMLNGLLPVRAFRDDLPKIETRFSMRVLRADSNPLASCEANVADILKAFNEGKGLSAAGKLLEDSKARPPGDVMLLGYSKGGPDIITTLAAHPDLASRIRCVFLWSTPLLGTAIADSAIKRFKATKLIANNADAISKTLKGFVPGRMKDGERVLRRVDDFDARACTRDLGAAVREPFMNANAELLDGLDLPMFTIRAATQKRDVPWIQRSGFKELSRADPHNDMQVQCDRALLPFPMGIDLGIVRGHHWDIAYPAFVKRNWFNSMYHGFPKTAAVVAMVQLAAELGLVD